MTIEKRLVANQRNALKSTGPRTLEGKQVTRWNALKHGLLSREVVIRAGEGKESAVAFRRLLAQLRAELRPEGVLEEMLVEKIAVCYWRLRRAVRAEMGEIRKDLDSASWRATCHDLATLDRNKRIDKSHIYEGRLHGSSFDVAHLLSVLEDIEAEVEAAGVVDEYCQERLLDNFGDEEWGLAYKCIFFSMVATGTTQDSGEREKPEAEAPDPDRCKQAILDAIRHEKKMLTRLKEIHEEEEDLQHEARRARLALPSKEVMDKILRYETTIERQLYRAINELERSREVRLGVRPSGGRVVGVERVAQPALPAPRGDDVADEAL